MKQHTTNYFNTFIVIADDSPATEGEVPPVKEKAITAANMQFDMVYNHPYRFTSDDVLFQVYANKQDLTQNEYAEARAQFFSKGQPCFRASPLTKRYGWGVHYDKDGKMAIYPAESAQYKKLSKDQSLNVIKAMKSSR